MSWISYAANDRQILFLDPSRPQTYNQRGAPMNDYILPHNLAGEE
jgi:hypothetical protein